MNAYVMLRFEYKKDDTTIVKHFYRATSRSLIIIVTSSLCSECSKTLVDMECNKNWRSMSQYFTGSHTSQGLILEIHPLRHLYVYSHDIV